MPLVLLYTRCAPAGQSSFTRSEGIWDTDARRFTERTSQQVACQVFELAAGTQIDAWCDFYGLRLILRYGGGAFPWSQDFEPTPLSYDVEPGSALCPLPAALTLGRLRLTAPTRGGVSDGRMELDVFTPNPPVLAVLSSGATAAGDEQPVVTLAFEALAAGSYALTVQDAAGARATLSGLRLDSTAAPGATVARLWLLYTVSTMEDQNDVFIGYHTVGTHWDAATKTVVAEDIALDGEAPQLPTPPLNSVTYARPATELVDSYYLPGGAVFRRVYHAYDEQGRPTGSVRFEDTREAGTVDVSTLRLENLTIQHVHQPTVASGLARGAAVGAVLVEARSPAPGPLTYLHEGTGESNTSGRFENLSPGPHPLRVTDSAGQGLAVPVEIEDRYRPRFYHEARTATGQLARLDVLGRDYTGGAEWVGATPDGLQRSWATEGATLSGELPAVSGQGCQLTLRATYAGQLSPLKIDTDDRQHRVDLVVGGRLVFRGYVLPDLYEEDLRHPLGGDISVTAADGLGALRDTSFLNHIAGALAGRWSLLSTVLLALSKCECGPLPLYVQTGLREALMQATDEPLAVLYGDRAGYRETGERGREWTCRQVLDAILQPFGTLTQREGAWWISSANAAPERADFAAYSAVGTPLAAMPAPVFRQVEPPSYGGGELRWINASQRLQVLAAARGILAETKLLLVENQLDDGRLQSWQGDLLRPLGWSGALSVVRLPQDATDAKPLAGQSKLRITATQPPADARLLSPAMAFKAGADEAPVRVQLRCRLRALSGEPETGGVAGRVTVGVYVNGLLIRPLLTWEVGSQEKEVTLEAFIPYGQGAEDGTLRVALFAPQPIEPAAGVALELDVYELVLRIEPGALSWPDTQQEAALNDAGFLVLPTVQVHHADTPPLLSLDGVELPVPGMNALAWRHALTYADGTPTSAWRRSYSVRAASLLQTVALDRLELRLAPVSVLSGPVRGAAGLVPSLGFGSLVEAAADAPGLALWCVGADVDELAAEATLTLREVGAVLAPPRPARSLITDRGRPLSAGPGYVLVWA